MSDAALWRDAINGLKVTTGSANAYVLSTGLTISALSQRVRLTFEANHTCTGASTLAVDGLAATAIRRVDDSALAAGDITAGGIYDVVYEATSGRFQILNPTPTATAYDAELIAIGALATTDGNFIVGDGATWVAESGATVRASAGAAASATTISAGGIATGGGDLSANRTITVTAASEAQAKAGTDSATAMTPQRGAQQLAAVYAADRTALALIPGSVFPAAYLRESGREGMFIWSSANLSAAVTIDTPQGFYVPPNSDATGASGAWVRDADHINVGWFGSVNDVVEVAVTASITSGLPDLTATGAAFVAGDVGKTILVPGAGAAGAVLETTILAWVSGTAVTLAANAGTTLAAASKTLKYFTEHTTKWQAAISTALALGIEGIRIPEGDYGFAGTTALDPGAGGLRFYADDPSKTTIHWYEGANSLTGALFKNIVDTTKYNIAFENIGFKGTQHMQTGKRTGFLTHLNYYQKVSVINCKFRNLNSSGPRIGFCDSGVAVGNDFDSVVIDNILFWDTPNCTIDNNRIVRTGDDAISVHNSDSAIGTSPIREGVVITNNRLYNTGMIRGLGLRRARITGNIQKFPKGGSAIHVGVGDPIGFAQGDNPIYDIVISENQAENLCNIAVGGAPGTGGSGIVLRGTPPRGSAGTNSTIPGKYDTVAAKFWFPGEFTETDTTNAANPVAPLRGITITKNRVTWNAPDDDFADYGYGSALDANGGEWNPAMTAALFRQTDGIVVTAGGLHASNISDNHIEHFNRGLHFGAPTTDFDYLNNIAARNILRDVNVDGVLFDTAAFKVGFDFVDNIIDGDPYRLNANSNIDGTYDADGFPIGFRFGLCEGASIRGGSITNVCAPFSATSATLFRIQDVKLICGAITAVGFNVGNVAIGNVPLAGGKYWYEIIDGAPNSATYLNQVYLQRTDSASIPTTGTWVRGAFVRNTTPALDGNNLVALGWIRLTTGSANVSGTDWAIAYVSHVTPAT